MSASSSILEDAELTLDGKITYAALIMLGSHKGLGRHLAQAETVFGELARPRRLRDALKDGKAAHGKQGESR